jgi:L-2-hydroxyglutarate oxidase LhgO
MTDAGITVIGAGVIGLAIAEKFSENRDSVFIIEKERTFGQETSSRNSEVIHAGIYYPHGSLKAKLCVEGKEMLYSFCKRWEVPFRNCGKIIVATSPEEVTAIGEIIKGAGKNGVSDLRIIDKDEIAALESEVKAMAGIWSPSTGIIDSHSLMKQLETNFINNGGNTVYKSKVSRIKKIADGYEITLTEPEGGEYTFTTGILINSAGLTADKISEMAGLTDPGLRITFCKGEYFRIKPPKNRLISRLVYPVPNHNAEGLGVHVTVDLAGGVKLGPDVTWLNENIPDYSVDSSKQQAFYSSASAFLPFLENDDLAPEMAGIRPKIQKPGGPQMDFYIKEESERGFPGLINLIGMESPGLTSCLAIAKYVNNLV